MNQPRIPRPLPGVSTETHPGLRIALLALAAVIAAPAVHAQGLQGQGWEWRGTNSTGNALGNWVEFVRQTDDNGTPDDETDDFFYLQYASTPVSGSFPYAHPNGGTDNTFYFRNAPVEGLSHDVAIGTNWVANVRRIHFDSATPYTLYLYSDTSETTPRNLTFTGGTSRMLVNTGHHTIKGHQITTTTPSLLLRPFEFNIATGASLTLDTRLHTNSTGDGYGKFGGGRLTLIGNNSGTGAWNFSANANGFRIEEGTLAMIGDRVSGSSSNRFKVYEGATLELATEVSNTRPIMQVNGLLTLSGTGVGGVGALYIPELSEEAVRIDAGTGSIQLLGDASIGVAAGKRFRLREDITENTAITAIGDGGSGTAGSRTLTKVGAGVLELESLFGNSYTGGTVVAAGTLLAYNTSGSATGSGTVTVNGSSAKIGGTGIIGALNVTNGTVAPGSSTGTLTTGDFSLGENGALEVEISDAGDYDVLVVNGTVSLAGTLDLVLLDDWSLANDELLFILRNDGGDAIDGTFDGLAEGTYFNVGGQNFQITYEADFGSLSFTGGNDVALLITAIPEPSVPLLAGIGAMCLWTIRRRKH